MPTTRETADSIADAIGLAISQAIPILPKSFTRVAAKVIAGGQVLTHKYAGVMFLQWFVRHASAEPTEVNGRTIIPLEEWGVLVGVGKRLPATRAELVVSVNVTNQQDSIANAVPLLGPSNGVIYETITETPLDASTKEVQIRAIGTSTGGDGSGSVGNLEPGATVEFANPLANVSRTCTVISQAVVGAEAETVGAYRARIIARIRRQPKGGAPANYQEWGEEVDGVVAVYPYPGQSPGTVDLYVEADTATDPDGIPTLQQRQAVYDSVQGAVDGVATRRPVGAAVNVFAIARRPFGLRIFGMQAPDLLATKAAISVTAGEYFRSREPFISGLSTLRADAATQAEVSAIVVAVVHQVGGYLNRVELLDGTLPIERYDLKPGEKCKLDPGGITYL